jgi:hypothetical protein
MYLLCFAKSFVLVLDGHFVFVFSLVCYDLFFPSYYASHWISNGHLSNRANFCLWFNSIKALKGKLFQIVLF